MNFNGFDDRALLSWWEPRLVRVTGAPNTIVVRTDPDLRGDELLQLIDGNVPAGIDGFLTRLGAAVDAIRSRGPVETAVLIRTGWTPLGASTLRRAWRSSLPTTSERESLLARVTAIVSRFQALPPDFPFRHSLGEWAVRELLQADSIVTLDADDGMPLVPEVRVHVRHGGMIASWPRWRPEDIERGLTEYQKKNLEIGGVSLATLFVMAGSVSMGHLTDLSAAIGRVAMELAFEGPWNVDLMETRDGWKAIGASPAPHDVEPFQ